ncbi:MAG: hypothetical protein GX446_07205 [Chthonomonadales bacterium]|nr:hypothetical protein [Chthonomonadales bacterium]
MEDDGALPESVHAAEERARSAEERARWLEVRLEVERCARQMGIVDEDAAFRLLDRDRIECDETGRPANVERLLAELAEQRPWLVRSDSAPSVTNPPRDGFRTLSLSAIRRMTPDEINDNWEAIQAALRAR